MSSNTDSIITRCPQCKTAFRVTAEVLHVASGTVRCGSCLRVFNANDAIVKTKKTPPKSLVTHKVESPQPEETPALPETDESWALALLEDDTSIDQVDIDNDTSPQKTKTEKPQQQNIQTEDTETKEEAPQETKDKETTSKEDGSEETKNKDSENKETEAQKAAITDNNDQAAADSNELEETPEKHSQADNISSKNTLIDSIELDSLELEEEHTTSPPWSWMLGSGLLTLILIIQLAWIKADELSAKAAYRPYYVSVCEILQCQLPPFAQLEKIHTSHLVIRSHPNRNNALIADAIIVNHAAFEQAYPGLRLEFLDIQGHVVASRDFQPHDYLRGELIDATLMPTEQPVQLSLAIVDPGEQAVNYNIQIVPPTSH